MPLESRVTIPNLPDAGNLTGTERLPLSQSGVTVDASLDALAAYIISKLETDLSGGLVSTGASGAYIVAAARNPAALTDGFSVVFRAHQDSVGGDTLKVSTGTTARALATGGGTAIQAQDIIAGGIYEATFVNASNHFRLRAVGPRQVAIPNSVESISPACRLDFVNSTAIRLNRFGGRQIPIPAGGTPVLRTIPSTGVDLASTGINAGFYYVYAYWTGSAIALEASATGWSIDTNTGLPIKTGDQTRVLVGAISLAANNVFADSPTYRGVASYWNRRPRSLSVSLQSNQATTTTSPAFFAGDMTFSAICWADAAISVGANVGFQHNTSGGRSFAQVFFDGNQLSTTAVQQTSAAGDPFGQAIAPYVAFLSEGLRVFQLRGHTAAGTLTWLTGYTTMTGLVWG